MSNHETYSVSHALMGRLIVTLNKMRDSRVTTDYYATKEDRMQIVINRNTDLAGGLLERLHDEWPDLHEWFLSKNHTDSEL